MKFSEYLKDKRYFIMFYLILMTFITLVIYLDVPIQVSYENIIYINSISFIFFLIYLITGFLYHKRYYHLIQDIIDNRERDIIYHLPEPYTYQQRVFNSLLKKVYKKQIEVIERQNIEKRENKEYVSTWVHEIKTPLAVSRLIIENSQEKELKEVLENLTEELDRIEGQVEQALYYSKLDVFEKDYFIRQLSLDKVIRGVIKKHTRSFISKKIELDLKEKNIKVNTDKKWLGFIIDQVLVNSLKYTGNNGKVSIWTDKGSIFKRLHIKDNGIGIKPEDLPRVFDKGFTGYIGRREEKSTGIGLYLAKKLAKRLGHDITIESEYGEYTKVTIIFPELSCFHDITE